MMTRKGMVLYLDEDTLERHRRSPYDGGRVAEVFFRDEYDFDSLTFDYKDWLHMGEPKTVTVHVYPGDRTDDSRETLESIYQHSEEDMKIAEYKLSFLNEKEDK